ncbi:MAG: hypothetical protein IKE70_02130 [Bacilli bacterium]|nr:hypothetical protein [Bacilli bacterium]
MEKNKETRVVSHIVSLVLGIISIITTFFWYISLPTGILSIIFGVKSYKKYNKKIGLAGMITGIVGTSICLFIYISLIIIIILSNTYY